MKKLFEENRAFRLIFIIILVLIVNVDVWIGVSSLTQYLGWFEYTSPTGLESNILTPIPYWISTTLLFVFSAASLIAIPLLSGSLQSENAPIGKFLMVAFISVALLPVVFIWSSSLNPTPTQKEFSGPELWKAVNAKREEKGTNELASNSWACSIAAIRLNDNLRLGNGTLDNHAGFDRALEQVTKPYEKEPIPKGENPLPEYFLEFLVYAYNAEEAIKLWENTMGHKDLFEKQDYKYGCAYAQGGYGVVITAY